MRLLQTGRKKLHRTIKCRNLVLRMLVSASILSLEYVQNGLFLQSLLNEFIRFSQPRAPGPGVASVPGYTAVILMVAKLIFVFVLSLAQLTPIRRFDCLLLFWSSFWFNSVNCILFVTLLRVKRCLKLQVLFL